MLRLSKSLTNQPIMSLRLGGRIATAVEPIINPHNLKIVGWWCKARGHAEDLVLLAEDVREVLPEGLAINDDDALSLPADLVRHKEVLDINFRLLEKPVRTKRHKLGRVEDYSYNEGMFVQKLYVGRPLVKVLTTDPTLLIDRTQILEVTDSYILVKDPEVKATAEELAAAPA
ncbi:MAG TPA: hypothetical protein VG964_02515 [Candidatus Saccharimonadales bacterium]|nr:hypothetical protein [Candidatus Saccharimonadales bacterium]